MRPSRFTTSALTGLALAGLTAVASARSAQSVLATELQVPVQGLEAEQAETVERALLALENKEDPPRKLLAGVAVDVDEKLLTLEFAPEQELTLTRIQRALALGKARVDPARLRVKEARLVIRAAPDEEDRSEVLERVLRAKAAFSEVKVERDTEASLYRVSVKGGSERATHEHVRETIEAASEGLSLADVVWSSPKAP